MGVPKQRRSGQTGGGSHRDSYRGFRNSGGNVKPPKKGCFGVLLVGLALSVAATAEGVRFLVG